MTPRLPVAGSGAEPTDVRRTTRAVLIEQFNSTGDVVQALLRGPTTVLDLVPARGAAIQLGDVTATLGDAPEVARIQQVVELLRSARPRLPVVSDSLVADHPRMAQLLPGVAGLLIVPIDGARGLLAWFRPGTRAAGGRSVPWDGMDVAAVHLGRDLDGAILRDLHADLAHFGFHDALTGLSNERLLTTRIEHALAGPTRGAGTVLLLIDINAFTRINGSRGHDRGDEVLIQAADRIRSVTRASDTVARLAGDVFVVLAGGADRIVASRIAERVLTALGSPVALAGGPIRTTVSIGVAEAEADDTAGDLLRRARTAMTWAKDFGRTEQTTSGLSGPPSRTAFMTGDRVESW